MFGNVAQVPRVFIIYTFTKKRIKMLFRVPPIYRLLIMFCSMAILSMVMLGWQKSGSVKPKNRPPGKELVLSLQPGPNNPRNSEGSFITLKDGSILLIYSHYTGNSTDDHAPAFLAGRFSRDGGATWSTEDRKIIEQEGTMNVMSVSLLRLKNGAIALFYLKKNSTSDCIPLMRISTDESKTWSEPVPCITDKKGYFVLNNDRVIQLKSGRIMMAVAMHQSPDTKMGQQGPHLELFF